ncbi:MAG: TAT-variant-translocated molybdopterin oxidoreductase [Bacteroidales bacterium]|nr:TAT-variant-translocated molybdopterin oxidoreductase [Bacteroidales bacterium]
MKKYWKSLDEYNGKPEALRQDETKNISALELLGGDSPENKASRRDFLKWCGFSFMSAAVLSSCESPVKKAIPYLNQPEEVTPGMASWYASSFYDGKDYCPVLVKVRDGRPIKIEGNELSTFSGGGTHARVQALVLGLYDTAGRYQHPLSKGNKISWENADAEIIAKLSENDGDIVILTSTIISPSSKEVISRFIERYPNAKHIAYDAISYSAMREANNMAFGLKEIPFYRFDNAQLIVGFNADFLANWLLPIVFARQYSETRRIGKEKKTMSLHLQFESGMSVTGSNADERFTIKPQEELQILQDVYNFLNGNQSSELHPHAKLLGEQIQKHGNKTLIVSGTNDLKIQSLVNAINHLAGSYGTTIDFTNSLNLYQGKDSELLQLVRDMEEGKVSTLIVHDANPMYDFPGDTFRKALEKVSLKISLSSTLNETAEVSDYVLPSPHYLESWDDVAPAKGVYGVIQPVITPLFDTRQMQDSLLQWSGNSTSYKDFLKENWENKLFQLQSKHSSFNAFWQDSLQQGFFTIIADQGGSPTFNTSAMQNAGALEKIADSDGWNLLLYESTGIGDGRHANNPWLQELPDPITKVCWDNFAAISPVDSENLGVLNGDIIRIGNDEEIAVLVQPGQAPQTLSIAVGYGRTHAGKVAEGVGLNAYRFADYIDGFKSFTKTIDAPEKARSITTLALTQTHHNMEGRAIVRESTLPDWIIDPTAGNELHEYHEKHKTTLYPEVEFEAHHWAMAVDLNSCIGCNNCVVACQAENNIPVVGKKEVTRRRIMHWIRIDRYYTGKSDNPGVVYQPMMCQHCDNAPCENVCPVGALTHSDEGISQVTYNRCVGTKYCITNCPYKVRRFNWFEYARNKAFDYNMNDAFGRLVLNPDVTVRERGVVEKCSFCVQRIQEKKLIAKLENRQLRDGDIKTACMQSCPTKALVFGDLNNPESEVSKLFRDERNYHVLEELHTLPSVGYLTKIRNKL